jgi:ATP-dependent exoDNAse (exonuclease V) beta subunit
MTEAPRRNPPPDQAERERALDASRSVLVRAPAGSGKTDLLTRRFLRLLSEVDSPGQIVAITFTKAAAAEMRNRILAELEKAAQAGDLATDPLSMESLAQRALAHSLAMGWKLIEQPSQLRISTIDAFCRDLALQQPLLSGLGGGLEIGEQPRELYRRAARRTLERIGNGSDELRNAIEALLLWRDNNWQDLENQLVQMLAQRDRWMHGFVLGGNTDWETLREALELPFAREVKKQISELDRLFSRVPGAQDEAHALARFGCEQSDSQLYRELAEMPEFPRTPFSTSEVLEDAHTAYLCLADLLLTGDGAFRKQVNIGNGFPKEHKGEKTRVLDLIAGLKKIEGLESTFAAIRSLPPMRYSEDEWAIVRSCFTLLRHAAAELCVVFAEAATADFTEVAQIALSVLRGEHGAPSDAALAASDNIHHLLVDEFQDTSRRQHQFLAHLVAAWPGREGRTCFVVGDPMQSIYFFRDADAELFPRVEELGLEVPGDQPLRFDPVQLRANFRTAPELVERINHTFELVFAKDDGSGVRFTSALAAREELSQCNLHQLRTLSPRLALHTEFIPGSLRGSSLNSDIDEKQRITRERSAAQQQQIHEIVALIRERQPQIDSARANGKKYRIAVLGRTRRSLAPIALALREAGIAIRAVELEELHQRTEIVDALALVRALMNSQDRVAWLGVLRAPWCGLSLADLHTIAGDSEAALPCRPVADLLGERLELLSAEGREAAARVLSTFEWAKRLRTAQPAITIGTWIEQVWLRLGGTACVDAIGQANLDLLWASLDGLPEGEIDLAGSALHAALEKLTAQPDPEASCDCGVLLMTIHKSKGLEFEVVVIPELEAHTGGNQPEMLSWLERGLKPDAGRCDQKYDGEVTEFLVAPMQSRGTRRGVAKSWVDRVRREREQQEMRRLLYVAATRAREELHLFARPTYRCADDGMLSLSAPNESLLATVWPAWEEEIHRRFEEWRKNAAEELSTVASLAASAAGNLLEMPQRAVATLLKRLPAGYEESQDSAAVTTFEPAIIGERLLYSRHEGGLISRILGSAAHEFLDRLARLFETLPPQQACAALPQFEPRIAATIRAAGIDRAHAGRIAAQALEIALGAAADPFGQWILAPHAESASEMRWTAVIAGSLHTVQADRVFRACATPGSNANSEDGEAVWWIVDYKTAHENDLDPAAALHELRSIFAPQIEAYAKVLRKLHGADARVHGGLYYPHMKLFDWWEL